ncbi:zinc finger family protein [Trypanosoma rangeli]|uniref:Zinc finger family protein n=1 Tax=Trypanosoma rangeli TaxID=5698 RepID=A0A3R7KAZ9_TRYRA|nr:zinc finger family protein [Trypanosoma rangeli]RNF04615.1 zinc finger family protein [Trypanosoma rangeli]|eukprot:RNF04615.1 zinc finger family protein [Trypanosoma rangeli]
MGNRQTAPAAQHLVGGPKTFYLVSGRPTIRYIGQPPITGPLIFHLDTDQVDDAEGVDRAETIHLPVAVPSRQSFRLTQFDPKNKEAGFLLSFSITMLEPGRTLRVLAGVDIEYHVGEGVLLMQSERSQNPFCLFEYVSPEEFQEEIVVSEPLHIERLRKANFRYAENRVRRLVYAPIAIELLYEAPADEALSYPQHALSASNAVPVSISRRECGADGNRLSAACCTSSPPSTVRIAQYTFLNIPDGVRGHTTLPFLPQGESSERETRPVYEAKMVQQLLQHGTEVYELADVYDLGGDYNTIDSNGEEEMDLCVICLTSARNTTILPCRHMCLCHECASVLRFQQSNCCPVCRANIERVMTI